ncbi:3_t:CDS:1, partial [Rhizophagus irregularis]
STPIYIMIFLKSIYSLKYSEFQIPSSFLLKAASKEEEISELLLDQMLK